MGKLKMRRKDCAINTVSVGYCDLYYLLRFTSPIGYNAGIYGWNWDYYEVNGLGITTGYRNLIGERAKEITKYNELAKFAPKEKVLELLDEFCKLNGGY